MIETFPLAIAPMMAYSDRHFRMFMRCLSSRTLLYSEMLTANAVIHGDRNKLLGYDAEEHSLVLQLGGSDPANLAQAARIAEQFGYDQINLNVGCPSERVQAGQIGVCLMRRPELVAQCVAAMRDAVAIPVTVKTRIGVDHDDSEAFLNRFIELVAAAGCQQFTIHARKAWLNGLSPKENRDVPPLNYPRVYALKQRFPELEIVINGGIRTIAEIKTHLQHVDGVMLGRVAYQHPALLLDVDHQFFDVANPPQSLEEVVLSYRRYMLTQLAEGVPLARMTRHLVPLFQGVPGAKAWRRVLTEEARSNDIRIVDCALSLVS